MNLNWDKAYEWGWVAILAILAGYELWAVAHGKKSNDPPLTWLTIRYVPWWVTMPFLTWLWMHFAIRYANPNYLK